MAKRKSPKGKRVPKHKLAYQEKAARAQKKRLTRRGLRRR